MQGTITTLELPTPTPDEPDNLEFFMEWDVPLQCDEGRLAQEEDNDE